MKRPAADRGLFVTFEGGDGCGKSTQAQLLAERARTAGLAVTATREPGGTTLGERLREALLGSPQPPAPAAELLIFEAARAQLVTEVIRPALARGELVISDRFTDSSVAYQHCGHGIDRATVDAANEVATEGLEPDVTLLLDLPVEDARARAGEATDYMERQERQFHERVREGYLRLAAAAAQRCLVLDARRPQEQLAGEIWARVEAALSSSTNRQG